MSIFLGVFINRIKFLYIWGLLFVWISFALSVTWHSYQLHGCRKPKSCLKIPLLRTLRRSRPAALPLHAFPVHVPGPGAREPHHPHCQLWPPPPPPMYFFISHLSLSDICFNSTVVPKMLANIQTQSKVITYEGCIIQMYFFLVLGYLDNFLPPVMADDHYVAICHPLNYTVTMSPHLCALLALVSRFLSVLVSLLHSLMVLHLSFSTHMEILNFCEFAVVLKSACLDALSNYIMLYSVTGLLGIPPLSGILFSYSRIISSILNISLVEGNYKAFCVLWVSPNSHLLIPWDRIRSISQFCLLPLLLKAGNCLSKVHCGHSYAEPFIYSLTDRDMNGALRKLASMFFLSLWGDVDVGMGESL